MSSFPRPQVRIAAALAAGVLKVRASARYVLLAYLWNLALAAVFAASLYGVLRAAMGSSLAGERMRTGFDALWYQSFAATATGLAATFKPSVSGLGAVLEGMDALLDGFLGQITAGPSSGVLPLMLLYLVSWTFLSAGFLSLYTGAAPARSFLAGAGRFFPRVLTVTLVGLVFQALLFFPLRDLLNGVREARLHDVIDERVRFAWTLAEYLLLWTVAFLGSLLFDYAKVVRLRTSAGLLRSLAAAATLVGRRPFLTGGVYVTLGLQWLLLFAVYAAFAPGPGAPQASTLAVLVGFLWGQVFLIGRIALRCLALASAVAVLEAMDAPAATPAEAAVSLGASGTPA